MKQATVLRRRRAERLARARRRDAWLAAGSLFVHILVILLLPGLAINLTPHQELLIELVRPAAAGGSGHGQTKPAPAPAAAAAAAQPETEAPAERTPTSAQPKPVTPTEAAKPLEQVKATPAAQPAPASNPVTNEATAISSAPVTVNESPQKVEDQPATPPAAEVIDEPVSQPSAPAEAAETQAAKPEPAAQPAGGATTETPAPEDGPANTAPAGETGDENSAEAGDGGEDEGDGPPPGPSAAELRLLGDYGDAARLRIRSQARNPEQGGSGIVTFEFEVAKDGHLIDVRIIRTSGYANLDNDALEATRAAFNERDEKVPFPSDVTVSSWIFVMSMKYPLY